MIVVLLLAVFVFGSFLSGKLTQVAEVAADVNGSPDWEDESDQDSANMGTSVAWVGDVNGDGYSDLVVGVEKFDNGQTNEGRVYAYYGSGSGLSSSPSWTVESNQAEALFGFSVAPAGDINGDGYDDVVIGARGWDNGGTADVGKVFLYYGSSGGLSSSPDWTYMGANAGDKLGVSVASAGDINKDDYGDIIIGAQHADNGNTDEGKAYLFLGGSVGLDSSPDWTYEGNADNTLLGTSVSSAGDIDDDGYDDVVIGAQWYSNGDETFEGAIFVFHGSSTGLESTPDWSYESNSTNARLGYSVSSAGDINGDGYSDIVAGAPWRSGTGRTYVFHGSSTGLESTPDWTKDGNGSGSDFGFAVSSAGDIDFDGYNDIIVGAPKFDNGSPYDYGSGSKTGLASTAYWTYMGSVHNEGMGYFVDGADKPGIYASVVLGATGYGNGQTAEGGAFLFYADFD